MKKIILLFSTALFFGCTKKDYSPYSYEESTIYSENNKQNFSNIVLSIKPYIMVANTKKYIVNQKINKVTLTINDDDFGYNSSFGLDTSIILKQTINSYLVTDEELVYNAVVPFIRPENATITAGDYSSLLNNFVILRNGFYSCRLNSFEIKLANGTIKKVSTNISRIIEVTSNTTSCSMGSLEVLIN